MLNTTRVLFCALFAATSVEAAEPLPSGNAVIRARAGESEIVITTTERVAGAIHSLTWKGKEFINSTDHGRQLQSASNYDAGSPITNETYNPTEAGCVRDGAGPTSSSRLLHLIAAGNKLQTTTQMAFWLAPDGNSHGNPAKNTTVLSNHLLTKRVQIGWKNLPHVIRYEAVFNVPVGERHTRATFESLTGYMPMEFSSFFQFDAAKGVLNPVDATSGEALPPLVFANAGGTHAMGIFAPPQPAPNTKGPTYGRFSFPGAKVVKWNCVFRVRNDAGIEPGDYSFRMFVAVGDLNTVRDSMRALHAEFPAR